MDKIIIVLLVVILIGIAAILYACCCMSSKIDRLAELEDIDAGSQSDAFENGDFIILTPSGVKDIASILESRKIKYQTILLDADKDLRLQRSLKRGDKVEEVLRRYDKDERDFRGVEAAICFNTTEWTDREVTAAAEMLRDLCRK